MLTISYDKDGKVVSDANAISFAKKTITSLSQDDTFICVGTHMMIDAFRVLVKRGEISHEQICFKHEDQILQVNPDGRLNKWPSEFCKEHDLFLVELL